MSQADFLDQTKGMLLRIDAEYVALEAEVREMLAEIDGVEASLDLMIEKMEKQREGQHGQIIKDQRA